MFKNYPLKLCHENELYTIWLKLVMSILVLPPSISNTAFTELLSQDIVFEDIVDYANFCRFKGYVQRQWQQILKTARFDMSF